MACSPERLSIHFLLKGDDDVFVSIGTDLPYEALKKTVDMLGIMPSFTAHVIKIEGGVIPKMLVKQADLRNLSKIVLLKARSEVLVAELVYLCRRVHLSMNAFD